MLLGKVTGCPYCVSNKVSSRILCSFSKTYFAGSAIVMFLLRALMMRATCTVVLPVLWVLWKAKTGKVTSELSIGSRSSLEKCFFLKLLHKMSWENNWRFKSIKILSSVFSLHCACVLIQEQDQNTHGLNHITYILCKNN